MLLVSAYRCPVSFPYLLHWNSIGVQSPVGKLNISVCGIVQKRFGVITAVLSLLGFDVVLTDDELLHVPAALPPGVERDSDTHWTGVWVGP